jgi:hypothetical protein
MLLKSKVIHKNNKYREFEPNPLVYNKKTSKNAVSQITRKILLFQKNAEFPNVRRIEKFFMACKFRLIICLSFHKKFGLKTICFA